MAFAEHPLRRRVVQEMHLRKPPGLRLPRHVLQLVRIVEPEQRGAEYAALARLAGAPLPESRRHFDASWQGAVDISWERHSEASTLTLSLPPSEGWALPYDIAVRDAIAWAEGMPGAVIRAMRMLLVDEEQVAEGLAAQAGFLTSHLISCHVGGGARLWSDFRIHDDGYGRLVLAANGLAPGDFVRCVQRLQELGNYRNIALLGLPVAQANWGALDRIEAALAATSTALAAGGHRDDDLLAQLTALSVDLLSLGTQFNYRMSATAAYAEIVEDRLAELDVRPIAGFQSLADFTARRFRPAMRTCAAFSRRIGQLGQRAASFTGLLRTRIETHIENQNGQLLASMDRSAKLQLRMQHLVESLSTVAISYYLLSLLAYPIKALDGAHRDGATITLAILVPITLATVFFVMRGLRHRLVSPRETGSA